MERAAAGANKGVKASILHVGPMPPPVGGVATALQMIVQCPALQQFDQSVFNTSAGQLTETVGRKRLSVRRVVRRLRLAARLAAHVRRARPDILHLQMGTEGFFDILGDFLLLWVGGWTGSRLVLHLHVDPAGASLPGWGRLGQRLFRLLARPASAIFVLTEEHRAHLLASAVCPLVQIVPNMCDEALFTSQSDGRHRQGGMRVIYVGRLTRPKGFYDFLRVAAQLRPEYPQIRFEAAGLPSSPEDERWIREYSERHSLQNTVMLRGLVTDVNKSDLFRRADILLGPSYSESLGIAPIEAMAAGLPVVATRVSGYQSSVVDDETGYLFEPGDVAGMAGALIRLLAQPALRERLGSAGRKRFLERYSAEHVGAQLAEAYHHILTQRRG